MFSCEHGCDEGFITTPGEERPCACLRGRRRAKPEFSPKLGVYAPGGVTRKCAAGKPLDSPAAPPAAPDGPAAP